MSPMRNMENDRKQFEQKHGGKWYTIEKPLFFDKTQFKRPEQPIKEQDGKQELAQSSIPHRIAKRG